MKIKKRRGTEYYKKEGREEEGSKQCTMEIKF
jgi:hypothetical protein